MTAPRLGIAALAAALAGPAAAGEVPGAVVTLEVIEPPLPARVATAAPMRFALLDKGVVYVGGTSRLAVGQLQGDRRKDLEKRIDRVLKRGGLDGEVRLGPGEIRHRIHFAKRNILVLTVGDPASAGGEDRLLGELVAELAAFDDASLRPYDADHYLMTVQRRRLPGGCRPWRFEGPPETMLRLPVLLPVAVVPDWTTGAVPTSVCAGGERYAVTLRPLVPGES